MIRVQLDLDDAVHGQLIRLAKLQGRTVSELVRDAVVRVYGTAGPEGRLRTLRAIEGLWRDREDLPDTDEYVRRLRRGTRSKSQTRR